VAQEPTWSPTELGEQVYHRFQEAGAGVEDVWTSGPDGVTHSTRNAPQARELPGRGAAGATAGLAFSGLRRLAYRSASGCEHLPAYPLARHPPKRTLRVVRNVPALQGL